MDFKDTPFFKALDKSRSSAGTTFVAIVITVVVWIGGWVIGYGAAKVLTPSVISILPSTVATILTILAWGFVFTWHYGYEKAVAVQARPIEWFKDMSTLNQGRGSLQGEIDRTSVMWVVWPAGHKFPELTDGQQKKVKRLLLGNPDADTDTLTRYGAYSGAGTPVHVASVIRHAIQLAKKHKEIEIKLHEIRWMSMVFGDPEDDGKGWVRFDYIVPYLPSAERQSFVLTRHGNPVVFDALKEAYISMWEAATPSS